MKRGAIYAPEAYARGKMLDHSAWSSLLPRHITPSDIDGAIDNNGRVLLMEFSSKTASWEEIPTGQRRLYESLVRAGAGRIAAALAHHRVPEPPLAIDTVKDVLRWSWMYWRDGQLCVRGPFPGEKWPVFVQKFCA